MLRIALIDILMFSLPFLVYGAYVLTTRRAGPADMWDGAPVLWLAAAGCLLLSDHHGNLDLVLGRQAWWAPITRRPSKTGW